MRIITVIISNRLKKEYQTKKALLLRLILPGKIPKKRVMLNRKVLSNLAISNPAVFAKVVEFVK